MKNFRTRFDFPLLHQEESCSISENVTWGQRKRMADGKISLPYAQFVGYKKGENGLPEIVPAEAEIIRLIFRLFMEGKTYSAIAKHLMKSLITTPAGKVKWQACGIQSILQNEKYKDHALLQKTYCANFLTKKSVKNTGRFSNITSKIVTRRSLTQTNGMPSKPKLSTERNLRASVAAVALFQAKLSAENAADGTVKRFGVVIKKISPIVKRSTSAMTNIRVKLSAKLLLCGKMRLKNISLKHSIP